MPKSANGKIKHYESIKSSNKQAPLSSATRAKLTDFFLKTAEVERKLEIIKEMLAQEQDFTPASLFHRLDYNQKGYLEEQDIERFFCESDLECKGSELKSLFGRINEDKSSPKVQMRDFQNFLLPNQNHQLRYFTMRRPVFIPRPNEKLNSKIQWITAKLFCEIIAQYSKLMEINKSLINSFDFDATSIFKLLAAGKSHISGHDYRQFLNDNGCEITKEETGCLIKVMDKRGQGQISIQDFKDFVATLGLKKQHQIFDELSPIPALKDYGHHQQVTDRGVTLKERYKDNKSYVKEFDEEGHHILGYSRARANAKGSPVWLSNSQKRQV